MPNRNTEEPRAFVSAEEYLDEEGEPLGAPDVQQGGTHDNRLSHRERDSIQGRKTIEGNRQRLKTGSADGN